MKKMKCKVVMLLSNDKATDFAYHGDKLINTRTSGDKLHYSQTNAKFQHLYLISDEEIKVGDWMLRIALKLGTPEICKDSYIVSGTDITKTYKGHCCKIIATTDTTLNLPLISQSFIEKYVEVNGKIEEVEIEMTSSELEYVTSWDVAVNKKNEVIISQPKETWTRDEIKRLFLTFALNFDKIRPVNRYDNSEIAEVNSNFHKWLQNNL